VEKLTVGDLHSLEAYAKLRSEFRSRVMEHKRYRRLQLGDHVVLLFEDRLTMQYQVQEMLRAERIFEEQGIRAELDAYNPLIPDGSNLKATMMIEYPEPNERRRELERLVGIEHEVWVEVPDVGRVTASADEDMERSTVAKTSAVHFLRFELTPAMVAALKDGAALSVGVNHVHYSAVVEVPAVMHESLIADLD